MSKKAKYIDLADLFAVDDPSKEVLERQVNVGELAVLLQHFGTDKDGKVTVLNLSESANCKQGKFQHFNSREVQAELITLGEPSGYDKSLIFQSGFRASQEETVSVMLTNNADGATRVLVLKFGHYMTVGEPGNWF